MRQLILVSIIFLCCFQVKAQNEGNNNWEIWQDKIPVSGGVRVGLMYEEKQSKITPLSFYVNIPLTEKDSICVEISSKDGRYSAKKSEPIKNNDNINFHEFTLPTKYKKELSNYKTDQVVILTSLNEDSNCSKKVEFYLISSWEEPEPRDKDLIVVYVNSQIPIKIITDGSEPINCVDLKTPTVAYNKKCIVPIVGLSKEIINLTIQQRIRRLGRIQFNPYHIPIRN